MLKKYILLLFLLSISATASVRDNGFVVKRETSDKNIIELPMRSAKRTIKTNDKQNEKLSSRSATNIHSINQNTKTHGKYNINVRSTVSSNVASRSGSKKVFSRSATVSKDTSVFSSTRTGQIYETCKSSYFTCMDQFCSIKNDKFRRCSCSDKVYSLEDTKSVLHEAGEKLTDFKKVIDSVGMTEKEAYAARTSSEGELALEEDKSLSKGLLQAIMKSIRGDEAKVGGKYSALNSINTLENMNDSIDAVKSMANYNGKNLYDLSYNQCRTAVDGDCNKQSLQRAITAYLMAIEQDCTTVKKSIDETKKKMSVAVRETNAMLDLARIENRKKHNSDEYVKCLENLENAILSEEVCGKNYHKCLDNGRYIDVKTGKPIPGVADIYKMNHLLYFEGDNDLKKLNKCVENNSSSGYLCSLQKENDKTFRKNFELKIKQFAEVPLDKCREIKESVWEDYLNKAYNEIHHAQLAKVNEIKESCFDFVSSCYMGKKKSLENAIKNIGSGYDEVLKPGQISLSNNLCQEYVNTCDNLFGKNIISEYINEKRDVDTLTACRAVAKQCFDKIGGINYSNFYYPLSSHISKGEALDWFSLYSYDDNNNRESYNNNNNNNNNCGQDEKSPCKYVSPCAKKISDIKECSYKDVIEKVFGGFDKIAKNEQITNKNIKIYAYKNSDKYSINEIRSEGVATEVYNNVFSKIVIECEKEGGEFFSLKDLFYKDKNIYNYLNSGKKNICYTSFKGNVPNNFKNFIGDYNVSDLYICTNNFEKKVDVNSYGICKKDINKYIKECSIVLEQCFENLDLKYLASKDLYGKNSYFSLYGIKSELDSSCKSFEKKGKCGYKYYGYDCENKRDVKKIFKLEAKRDLDGYDLEISDENLNTTCGINENKKCHYESPCARELIKHKNCTLPIIIEKIFYAFNTVYDTYNYTYYIEEDNNINKSYWGYSYEYPIYSKNDGKYNQKDLNNVCGDVLTKFKNTENNNSNNIVYKYYNKVLDYLLSDCTYRGGIYQKSYIERGCKLNKYKYEFECPKDSPDGEKKVEYEQEAYFGTDCRSYNAKGKDQNICPSTWNQVNDSSWGACICEYGSGDGLYEKCKNKEKH